MNEIDWKRKLTSRRFWAAVAGFITGLIVALGGSEATATQVSGLIMSGASVVAFIFGESKIDAARAGAEQVENWDDEDLE